MTMKQFSWKHLFTVLNPYQTQFYPQKFDAYDREIMPNVTFSQCGLCNIFL